MVALGITYLPSSPPEQLREIAQLADEEGLDELWLWEDCFKEAGVSSAAAALAWTHRLRVGVGLFPTPLRNVALTAMEWATLARMFPGRFLGAVGHGVQDWMGQVGGRVDSPLTLLQEYLIALRALLNGETVSTQGRYVHLDNVTLDWPPTTPPIILAGGTGPKTLALCGQYADGTLVTASVDPAGTARTRALVHQVRERAGLSTGESSHAIIASVMVATGPGAQERMTAERTAWNIASDLDCTVTGDAAAVAVGLHRWVEAGATQIAVQPTSSEPDLPGLIRFLARDVAPRLHSLGS